MFPRRMSLFNRNFNDTRIVVWLLVIISSAESLSSALRGEIASSMTSALRCPSPCKCSLLDTKLVVNCSKTGLRAFPDHIPPETSILLLQYNKIESLTNADLRNLPHLEVLDLSLNNINVTEASTFVGMQSIRSLNLSYNPLPSLADGFLSPLTNLIELNMTSTRVAFNPAAFVNLTKLGKFFFSKNRLLKFPSFSYHNRSVMPSLKVLDLGSNSLEAFHARGLDSLEQLLLGQNKINTMYANSLKHFKNLKLLNLFWNQLRDINPKAFCSKSLRKLDLGFSRFALTQRTRSVFKCVPNLEELSLIRCTISAVHHPFHNLTKLRKLNLGSTGVTEENVYFMLYGLTRLEWISLQANAIHVLKISMFATFAKSLKVLEIGSNRISTVNFTSLPANLWTSLEKIDLSDNPFTCDCELAWFLHWLATTNVTISKWHNDPKQYQCSAPADKRKQPLSKVKHLSEEECLLAPTDWCLLTVFVITALTYVLSPTFSVMYRFRWYMKYWYFKYQIHQREQAQAVDTQEYSYDAFVSYSKDDSRWVIGELRRHVESEFGLRLCIHDRDFEVGEDIAHNVLLSIEKSRKVLLIVSNAYALSQWCHFELIMAQTRVLVRDRDNLVLILLEEVPEANLPPRLKLQMGRQTYLEWTENAVGQQLFWERLRRVLGKSPQSVTNSPLPIDMFRLTN